MATPIAWSIRSRSTGVWGPYGIEWSAGRDELVVGGRVEQAGHLARVGDAHLDHPAGAVRVPFTSSGWPASSAFASVTSPPTGANRSLTALTLSTTPNVACCSSVAPGVGQLHEHDVAELFGREGRDPDGRDVAATRTHSWSLV